MNNVDFEGPRINGTPSRDEAEPLGLGFGGRVTAMSGMEMTQGLVGDGTEASLGCNWR